MGLPVLRRCCGCIPLEAGCIALSTASLVICIITMVGGARQLPQHKYRQNEDNLILMSLVMFSTLSCISNIVILIGIFRNKPSYLQLAFLSNSVFILCLFMVSVVACLFSPALKPYLQGAGYVVLVVFLMIGGAAYSMYHITVVNSTYTKMKMTFGDSVIPV